MDTYRVLMIFYLYKEPEFIEILYYLLSCLISVESGIFPAALIDRGVIIHDVDNFEVMSFSDFEIVRVMSRRNLNTTCSELLVNILVSHNRYLSSGER